MSSVTFTSVEKTLLKAGLFQLRASIQRSILKERNVEVIRLKNDDMRAIDLLSDKIGVV